MPPMWYKLLKILVLLFALFTTIVCINSEIAKRREAEAALAAATAKLEARKSGASGSDYTSDNILGVLSGNVKGKESKPVASEEFPGIASSELDHILRDIFIVNDDQGVHIFNTTTADSAPLMPINTMLGNQAENPIPIPNQNQNQNQKQKQSPKPRSSSIYHQYHSLNNHQDQYFKVQRSPDGKLNLVFNDTFVSLQGSNTQAQADQAPTTHKHPSDKTRPRPTYPPLPPLVSNISKPQQECGDNEPLESKSFCTTVKNYPDLSALKGKLSGKFAKFFNEEVPVELSSRVGTGDDEVYLCQSVTRTLYPKMGQKAEDSSWQFIVNDDEFKQGIQVEECTNPGEHCDYTDSFPSRYKTICKQHYVSRNLVSIKNDGKLDVAQDTFKIPSCCKCVLKPI